MQEEVRNTRRMAAMFDVETYSFRETFRHNAPVRWDCPDPYEQMEKLRQKCAHLDDEMRKLTERANLHNLLLPDFKALHACNRDLQCMKALWDFIYKVRKMFDEWGKTQWQKVNVEALDPQCKQLAAEVRDKDMLPSAVGSWDCFDGVETRIKAMATTLSIVGMLQKSPSISDSHW